ncbi:hypothetical protein L1987_87959 [Smallanthus sonchifolius]|nr:hypothetical protein L1987_87959 [Smallanthus sonchifolius]
MLPNFPHPSPPNLPVQHHLITTTSEETDSKKESNTTTNGGSIEAVRKRRGRPSGSKNKQKPPVSVAREPEPLMSPYVLEVSGRSDIVATVTQFCNHRKTGLCVLSGWGSVANVTFRQPTTDVIFQGRFNLLSISATILPPSSPSSTNSDFLGKFVVSLAGPRGQTVGGTVVGPIIASGTVYIVAVSFNNPVYQRLPMEEEEEDDDDGIRNSRDGSVSAAVDQNPGSGGGDIDGAELHATLLTAELLSMYGYHLPAGNIWAPTPRQAHPHSSLY